MARCCLTPNIEQMVASTTVDPYKILSKSIKSVRDRVTNISEHLPAQDVCGASSRRCMVRHIMGGSTDTVYAVTPEDDARITPAGAGEIRAHGTRIYGKNPQLQSSNRTGRFARRQTHGSGWTCSKRRDPQRRPSAAISSPRSPQRRSPARSPAAGTTGPPFWTRCRKTGSTVRSIRSALRIWPR